MIPLFAVQLQAEGYTDFRELPTREWACLKKMMFTTALTVGVDEFSYRTRFCYDGPDQEANARTALLAWDGEGFPPGYWIRQKPEDITNPTREAT